MIHTRSFTSALASGTAATAAPFTAPCSPGASRRASSTAAGWSPETFERAPWPAPTRP